MTHVLELDVLLNINPDISNILEVYKYCNPIDSLGLSYGYGLSLNDDTERLFLLADSYQNNYFKV